MKGNGQDIHELTRIEAYLLSEKAGHPSHMSDFFWTQAEAIVRQRVAIVDVAVKAADKKKPAKVAKTAKTAPVAKPKKTAEPQLPLIEEAKVPVVKAKKPVSRKAAPAAKKTVTKSK